MISFSNTKYVNSAKVNACRESSVFRPSNNYDFTTAFASLVLDDGAFWISGYGMTPHCKPWAPRTLGRPSQFQPQMWKWQCCTFATIRFNANRKFPSLSKVRTVVVQQCDQGLSGETHVRLIALTQLLGIIIAADCLQSNTRTAAWGILGHPLVSFVKTATAKMKSQKTHGHESPARAVTKRIFGPYFREVIKKKVKQLLTACMFLAFLAGGFSDETLW